MASSKRIPSEQAAALGQRWVQSAKKNTRWHRLFSVSIVFGIWILLIQWYQMWYVFNPVEKYLYFAEWDPLLGRFDSNSDFNRLGRANYIAPFVLVGGAMVVVGIFGLSKRFTLRILLACILFLGLIAMVPDLLTRSLHSEARFETKCGTPFSANQMNDIRRKLESAYVLSTMPKGLISTLHLSSLQSKVKKVELLQGQANKDVIRCTLLLGSNVSERQLRVLIEVYQYYFNTRVLEYMRDNGFKNVPQKANFSTYGGIKAFEDEWLQKIEARDL